MRLHDIILYYITLRYITLYYIMSHHIILCYIISHGPGPQATASGRPAVTPRETQALFNIYVYVIRCLLLFVL